mmetsp:Transcript_3165/g.6461  ORF Transcript_3165/g.6461 Transcript_3165/m.6461 type:complete len:350 (+) Transcript_3165:3-1052(+)
MRLLSHMVTLNLSSVEVARTILVTRSIIIPKSTKFLLPPVATAFEWSPDFISSRAWIQRQPRQAFLSSCHLYGCSPEERNKASVMSSSRMPSQGRKRKEKNAEEGGDAGRHNSINNKRQKQKKTVKNSLNDNDPDPNPDEWFNFFTKDDPLYTKYMTTEWGQEKREGNELFEMLSLEGAQSGLSWKTILHKREAYRKAFSGFDIDKVASMTEDDVEKLMTMKPASKNNSYDVVVRHRGKLNSVVNNAKIIQQMKSDGSIDSFGDYLWSFVDDKPILSQWTDVKEAPNKTEESEMMSKTLKKQGFKFVGPTTCYAFMQSCGMVIDHPMGSKWWREAEKRLKKRTGGYQIH